MDIEEKALEKLKRQIKNLSRHRGESETANEQVVVYNDYELGHISFELYEPAILISAQGQKKLTINSQNYQYGPGQFLALLIPMTVDCELIGVSEEEPMLAVAIKLERSRLSNLINRIEAANGISLSASEEPSSAIQASEVCESLLESVIHLLELLQDSCEAEVLSDSALDEVYFRLLKEPLGGHLKSILKQQSHLQQIAKSVEYLHANLDKTLSIQDVADNVNMSKSGFHKKFKRVMHMSPLQYLKNVRLSKAQQLIFEGKMVSEAGFLVGYSSPAQFSRDYKRLFGDSPSSARIS